MSELTSENLWEHNSKHIFILSSSGKPVFSRHGDEQELVTTFGLLQAVISIIQDSGDHLKCIRAGNGNRVIVYFLRHSLYFVAISSTREPEIILRKQLEFMYSQIILILTSKVHDVLKSNSSKDIRDLLGPETNQLLHAACRTDIVSPSIAFQAVKIVNMNGDLRSDIQTILKSCVEISGSVLGIMLHGDSLLGYYANASASLTLDTSDVLLLSHFIGNASSLKSHDQNWVPVCMPNFNSNAFLQAYICNLKIVKSMEFFLVLIAVETDSSAFRGLHESRLQLEKNISEPAISNRLLQTLSSQERMVSRFLTQSMSLHFFYKFRPPSLPAQSFESEFDVSVSSLEAQQRIWVAYQRLGVCMRVGSSSLEYSILPSRVPGAALADCSDISNGTSDINIMTVDPSSDHALSYAVLNTGNVIVGLATADSELYACFSGTISALDACGLANYLSRSLKADVANLFLIC